MGEAVHRHRCVQFRTAAQGVGTIPLIRHQRGIVLPAVRPSQIVGGAVCVICIAEGPGIAAGVQCGLRRAVVHRDFRGNGAKALQAADEGVQGGDRDATVRGIGEGVAVCHLCAPLAGRAVFVGARGEVPGDGPLRREKRVMFQRGQGQHRPGIGQKIHPETAVSFIGCDFGSGALGSFRCAGAHTPESAGHQIEKAKRTHQHTAGGDTQAPQPGFPPEEGCFFHGGGIGPCLVDKVLVQEPQYLKKMPCLHRDTPSRSR